MRATQLKKRAKLIQTLNAIPQDKHVELIKNLDTDSLSFLLLMHGLCVGGEVSPPKAQAP